MFHALSPSLLFPPLLLSTLNLLMRTRGDPQDPSPIIHSKNRIMATSLKIKAFVDFMTFAFSPGFVRDGAMIFNYHTVLIMELKRVPSVASP